MRLILLDYGLDFLTNQDDKYKMVISASIGEMKFEAIKNWIQARLKNKYDE